MIDGSEPRKTRRNVKDQSNHLRQRRSFCSFSAFCSFYESLDDVSWAEDESLWPVPVLFHAVVAAQPASPTRAKGRAEPPATAATAPPLAVAPPRHRAPPPQDAAAPSD